jgi:hypothetical protein
VTRLARVYYFIIVPLPSNVMAEWVALLRRTRKITASNLDTVVCYPVRVIRGFPLSLQGNGAVISQIMPHPTPPHPLHIILH